MSESFDEFAGMMDAWNRHYIPDYFWFPVQAPFKVWSENLESGGHTLASTYIGDVHVSTILLGHNSKAFETMVFVGGSSARQWHVPTWQEAEALHWSLVIQYREAREWMG